jgi:hypothetical protein
MKKVTITPKQQEIDWSKPQWVQHNEIKDLIVLTTGTDCGFDSDFEGTAMPCNSYPKGDFNNEWTKSYFHLLTEEINFTISNQD